MNYAFLRGKIVEKCSNCGNFAKELGISYQELSNKLRNQTCFTQKQILDAIKILELDDTDLKKCFFIEK